MAIGVGDAAPEFTLVGTDGTEQGRRTYSLSEFRGQVVVLVFYPADNSPVCTRQPFLLTLTAGTGLPSGVTN